MDSSLPRSVRPSPTNSGRQKRRTTSPAQIHGARAQLARMLAYGSLVNIGVHVRLPFIVMLFEHPASTHPENTNPE